MRILIELPTWLGDAVMATPAIENLVNYYDEPEVILIGSYISIELLKNHPRISNTYVIRKKYTSLYKISKKLGQFDIFFSFRSSLRTKFFKLLISSKKKFQFDGDRYQNRHQVEKYNDFINDNLNTNFHPGRLIVHPSLKPKDNNSKPIVGINPGASYGDSKRWHPEKFAKVATELSNKFDILIFGGPNEKEVAEDIENHARHSGKHAAGIIVLNDPVQNFCSVNKDGVAQIEKKDAEALNILKIDALGLRTLSILEDCLNEIGKERSYLLNLNLEDKKTFDIFNKEKFAGIFQFEGYALQSLCKQMSINKFLDIAYITTLARPGPLHCGGTTEFIKRRTGEEPITYLHEKCKEWTADSYGVIIFQEQVMQIARNVGKLSWEDTSELRKAMSRSLGEEFFNQYWELFKDGAKDNGIEEKEARNIWEHMCTFGSWAFNKSHAISYAMISYWCAYLKANHPLEFAVACLRNSKDDEQVVKLLRELIKEGFKYEPFNKKLSEYTWSVKKGKLIGGLIGLKGIGPKNAEDILQRRANKTKLTTRQDTILNNPDIPYLDVFECHTKFGDYYKNPQRYNIQTGEVCEIKTINENDEYIFIGKLKERNLRDLNEYGNLVKRGGRKIEGNNLFLNLTFEDDSDMIIATVDRFKYLRFGKLIIEESKIGDWFLIKGNIRNSWRKIFVSNIRKLDE